LALSANSSATPITADTKGLQVQQATAADLNATVVIASGTVTAISGALPVGNNNIGNVDIVTLPTVATATLANVNSSATNVTLQASNTARLGWACFNDSTAILYIKFGATASATSFTVKVAAGGFYEMPVAPVYTGIIDGIWASANGAARVTEL
jgi:hypothetical protein